MSVDYIIELYENALADHRRAFSRGIMATECTAIKKANDAIGYAADLAYKFLKLPKQNLCNEVLLQKLRVQSASIAQAKRESDIQKAQFIWTDLEPGDVRRTVSYVAKRSDDGYSWPTYEKFIEILDLPDNIQCRTHYDFCAHVHSMYIGKWAGRWELSWDMFPNDDVELYPIQLKQVSIKETSIRTFPALLSDLGLFKSSSEAKKNGWNKPLATGDFFFKKKTYILRITE